MCNRTSRPCCSVSASSASRATQTLRPSRWPALSATSTPPALPSLQPGRLQHFPSDSHQTSSTHSRRPQPGDSHASHPTSSTHSRRPQPGDSHTSRPTPIRLLLPIHVDHSRETPTLPIRPLLPIHVVSETVLCQASKTCLPPYNNDMCSRVSTFRLLIVPSRRTCHVVFSQLCHQL